VATLESLLVGLIVFGCTIFSAWRLMSVRLRLKALEALSVLPAGAGGNLVAMLRRKTLAKLSGGCGACHQATHTLNANVQSSNRSSGAPRR
jgi:hypothetical protein